MIYAKTETMSDDPSKTLNGHCLCGACKFQLIGQANWVGHCHCDSCRRATASPMTTFIGQENGRWKFTGLEPAHFESSPGNTRGFCPRCGSPLYFQSVRFPNETHFYAALLDNPEAIYPTRHFHADEKLSWLHLSDGHPSA